MNEADVEEMHYRRQVHYALDHFLTAGLTVDMVLPGLMLLFPMRERTLEGHCRTALSCLLIDLRNSPASCDHVCDQIVGMVVDAARHEATQRTLSNAIDALTARGHIITQVNALGVFQVDGAGRYSVEDILDAAER